MRVLDSSKRIRKRQTVLLIANMLVEDGDELPLSTIKFMAKVYPVFLEVEWASATTLANAYGSSVSAALKHIRVLTSYRYLTRVHHRAWALNTARIEQLDRSS